MICECGNEIEENLNICENCGKEIIHKKLAYKDSLKYQLDKVEKEYNEKKNRRKTRKRLFPLGIPLKIVRQ